MVRASDSTGEAVARVLTSSASGRPRKAGTERDLKSHLRRFITGLYFCLKRVGAGPGVFSSKVSDLEAKAKETQPSSLAGRQWLKARSFLTLWLKLPSFAGIRVIYARASLRQQLPLCSPSRVSGCSQTPSEERQNSAFHRT